MEYSSVSSKKYVKQYKQNQNHTPPTHSPLIGCVYQAKTVDKLNVTGILMEYGDVKSTIKNKHEILYTVLSKTLKSLQI